jgi:ATP-binding cassette, subfamily G (WHITE), member 2, SNQ2
MRTIYELRERPSRIYGWTALLTSQILVALPWNILGSTIFFCCWYWTVGFDSSRAGYTYLALGVIFPLYFSTVGQVALISPPESFANMSLKAVASMAPSAQISAILSSFVFSFVIIL